MDGHTSPGRFLAYLLAEHDLSVEKLCRRTGLDNADAWALLSGRLMITLAVAEQLGKVFRTPGFWLIRQAMWELELPADEQPD
ncbi:transcriptional regulator [Pantoea sp. At-9b]|jgi:antitoxin HigA-1|uniref:helix-turn-helix transcriptional regulator n=1 Tax=Pantoea sp. (strain At-9b) TaxID=592316 RepID=UPI0001B3FDE8|nr:transcriptional regulator [Pantoea sp. At-9b]ADU72202.1 putative plasmid maintenance system antidote protein, XRE family [Pantoea sp. At-9b]